MGATTILHDRPVARLQNEAGKHRRLVPADLIDHRSMQSFEARAAIGNRQSEPSPGRPLKQPALRRLGREMIDNQTGIADRIAGKGRLMAPGHGRGQTFGRLPD